MSRLLAWGLILASWSLFTFPALAQNETVTIDFTGLPAQYFGDMCGSGEIGVYPYPVQTVAGPPLYTPYATFTGGEVENRFTDNPPYPAPPLRERYRSLPWCIGDLPTFTIDFRFPVSELSVCVSLGHGGQTYPVLVQRHLSDPGSIHDTDCLAMEPS